MGQLTVSLLSLKDAWSCSLLPFPTGGILGGKELRVHPRVGLAWQRVAGLFFFGGSRRNRL